jgi:hypothetical protein
MLGGMRVPGIAFAMLHLAACSGAGGEGSSPEAAPPAGSPTEAAIGETPSAAPTVRASGELPPCGANDAFFSVSPVELSDFMGLVPLGNFAPSGHVFPTDHIYFHINRIDRSQWELGTIEVPVVSPGDVWVTEIRSTRHVSDDRTDYDIHFSPCDEVVAFFIHVSSLSEELEESFSEPYDQCHDQSTGEFSYQYCSKSVNVKLAAGETIGTAGGDQFQNALDLGVYDLRTDPHPYANPDRWGEKSLHIVCPLDYFTADVGDALRAKLGSHDGTTSRAAPPVCGEVEQDEPGTAQGVWLVAGATSTYPEDPHLTLAHDNVDPSTGVFSVGVSMAGSGLSSGLYYFDPTSSGVVNRDFKDVTADGAVYCYETRDRFGSEPLPFIILVQLTSPTTLRSERQDTASCGSGPWQFSSAYADYER